MIRYRPYFTIDEMMYCLTDSESSCLCHPILRDKDDPVRKLILHLEHEHNTKKYKSKNYPWYEEDSQNYEVSIPIYTQYGNKELVVRSGSKLTHYYRQAKGNGIKVKHLQQMWQVFHSSLKIVQGILLWSVN